jgi:hypothetical protein
MTGDLFGAALGGDVLGARELGANALTGKAQQVTGYERYRAARAFLPRRVGGRIHHDLTDDSPAGVMGVAASDEKPCKRLGDTRCPGLGGVAIQMPQCGTHVAPAVNSPRELRSGPPRLVCWFVDRSTVLPSTSYAPRYCLTRWPRGVVCRPGPCQPPPAGGRTGGRRAAHGRRPGSGCRCGACDHR